MQSTDKVAKQTPLITRRNSFTGAFPEYVTVGSISTSNHQAISATDKGNNIIQSTTRKYFNNSDNSDSNSSSSSSRRNVKEPPSIDLKETASHRANQRRLLVMIRRWENFTMVRYQSHGKVDKGCAHMRMKRLKKGIKDWKTFAFERFKRQLGFNKKLQLMKKLLELKSIKGKHKCFLSWMSHTSSCFESKRRRKVSSLHCFIKTCRPALKRWSQQVKVKKVLNKLSERAYESHYLRHTLMRKGLKYWIIYYINKISLAMENEENNDEEQVNIDGKLAESEGELSSLAYSDDDSVFPPEADDDEFHDDAVVVGDDDVDDGHEDLNLPPKHVTFVEPSAGVAKQVGVSIKELLPPLPYSLPAPPSSGRRALSML